MCSYDSVAEINVPGVGLYYQVKMLLKYFCLNQK